MGVFEEAPLAITTFHKLAWFSTIFIFSIPCFGSQLDCRSKTAYIVAKEKANYSEQIPNETIEFAKRTAMEMCVSMANNKEINAVSNDFKEINESKRKKRSFLGINFGNSERKKGNERLMNRR